MLSFFNKFLKRNPRGEEVEPLLRKKVEELMKDLPFYEETVDAYLKFARGQFRTLNDRMTPLERLQDHYFRIQANPLYVRLRKWKLLP